MRKFKVRRRYPNYMTGFEETEHFIDTRDELEKVDWVDNWKSASGFHTLAISKATRDYEQGQHSLMALLNYDEKFSGCKTWWVIGFITGEPIDELELEEWDSLIGNHLDGCPQKKWQHNECDCGFRK